MSEVTYEKSYELAVETYKQNTPKCKENYLRARKFMSGGETRSLAFFHPYPLSIESAKGCRMTDLDGNTYIDFLCNYTSMIHAYAHPEVTNAVTEAMGKGASLTALLNEQIELAEILCERIPSLERVRFCNSGTEATMFALRTARAYTGRDAFIKMEGGYHGTTDWAEFSIAKSDPINRNPLMPVPNSRGIPLNPGKDLFIAPFNDLETVENILKAHAKEIAAILLEPILGGLGIICPLPGYLQGLRTLADKYDVLLIFDEVQTLRVSYGGAQEKYGVIPDITAVAKIIGGGLPIGAFGGREDIMAVYDQTLQGNLSHGGTFNGNRAAMAAGVVTMKLFDHAAIEKLELLGARLEKGLKNAIKENNVPMSVNRVGSLLHVHLVPESPHNWLTVAAAYPIWHLNTMMHLELINRGVFTAPRGTWALCTAMTEADIDLGIKAFAESVAAISPYFKV